MTRKRFMACAVGLGVLGAVSAWSATTPTPPVADIPTMAQTFVKELNLAGSPVCSTGPVDGTNYSCAIVLPSAFGSPVLACACGPDAGCLVPLLPLATVPQPVTKK